MVMKKYVLHVLQWDLQDSIKKSANFVGNHNKKPLNLIEFILSENYNTVKNRVCEPQESEDVEANTIYAATNITNHNKKDIHVAPV